MSLRVALCRLPALAVIASLAHAAPATVADSHSRAALLAETVGWMPGRPLRLGLDLRLDPGWHTYWSNPGDAGLPPSVTVALDGADAQPAALRFPSPQRLPTGPLMGYGYTGGVLLPFVVSPPSGAPGALAVSVHADWLVCASVCVPQSADLALRLPRMTAATLSPDAPSFARADRSMPRPSPFAASLSSSGLLRLAGRGIGPRSIASAWFMPEAPGRIDQGATQTQAVSDGALTLSLDTRNFKIGTLSGVLALKDPAGVESDFLVSVRRDAPPPATRLLRLVLLALAGGLVLNLMPCVFPVLAMKAIALLRHGPDARARRRSASLYTAGVLASFLAIGVVTLALRSAGSEAGWGGQFQSPAFVAATAWLLFAVGLNLAGLFEVGARLAGAGQGLASKGGALGDLMTGVLAVLVATPCTAPFMGVAVAAALSGPPAAGLAIFGALGLGLALPSLVLGFVPGASRLLPRPGGWMLVLRQVLAFPMFAASVWLLWVLSEESGSDGVLAGLTGLLMIGFAGWLHGLVQRSPSLGAQTGRGLNLASLAVVLAALSVLPGLRPGGAAQARQADGAEPFTASRLAALRQDGHPVFVDMSAAWCVTCLINERLALAPSAVRSAFASGGVTLLRGDWTRRDAGITDFLHRFGRDGVPLYVFFPANDGEPQILPQVLTPGLVLRTITARA